MIESVIGTTGIVTINGEYTVTGIETFVGGYRWTDICLEENKVGEKGCGWIITMETGRF